MAVELIPSVLATTPKQLRQRWTRAESLAPTVHLDIMDGRFVRTRSVAPSYFSTYKPQRPFDLHAMVKDVSYLAAILKVCRPHRVYIPIELGRDRLPMERLIRQHRALVGYAISPQTKLTRLWPVLKPMTRLLVMGVNPGRYGAPFVSSTVRRIRAIRKKFSRVRIFVDGAMNPTTIPACIVAGCSGIIVGSDVMLRPDPVTEWKRLQQLTA